MLLFNLAQRFFALLSLAVLGTGVYFIWRWASQPQIFLRDTDGSITRLIGVTPLWPLILGLGLLGILLLGRMIVPLFLSKAGGSVQARLKRSNGQMLQSDDGAELYVEQHGRKGAPIIIFTHGWGMDSTIWHEARARLGNRFHLITWDLPGLGKSTLPRDGRISVESMAANLKTILSLAQGERVVLVGHSIGGMIVQTLCSSNRELLERQIAGIALENTTHTNPLETMILPSFFKAIRWPIIEPMLVLDIIAFPIAWVMNWLSYWNGSAHISVWLTAFGSTPTRAQLDHIAYLQTRNSPAVQAKGTLSMMRWSVTQALPRIMVPTLIFVGERDLVTVPGAGVEIQNLVPHAKLARIEHAGHMGPVEFADEYNDQIARFASSVLLEPSSPSKRIEVDDDALADVIA